MLIKHLLARSFSPLKSFRFYTTQVATFQYLELKKENNSSVKFGPRWLRDHCRCSVCLNHKTFQRQFDLTEDHGKTIKNIFNNSETVEIIWEDEHKSIFNKKWLLNIVDDSKKSVYEPLTHYKLWDRNSFSEMPTVDCGAVMEGDHGLLKWMDNIKTYGFGVVKGCPLGDHGDTELIKNVMMRLGNFQQTIYSDGVWDILLQSDNENLEFLDTAYTNLPLLPHVDGNYMSPPPGLQFFQIPFHDGVGGETILVDGFNVSSIMKSKYPEYYNYLVTNPLYFYCVDNGACLRQQSTVIVVDNNDKFVQFRYNNNDRMPMYINSELEDLHYNSLSTLLKMLKDSNNQLKFKLPPDWLLVTNNWRVLHGRTGFTGNRRLLGSYISMESFLSKHRLLVSGGNPLESVFA